MHPFDESILLEPRHDGRLAGVAPAAYWNVVGPYGGITAAIALAGVLRQPGVVGEPLALTVNFAAPIRPGPFALQVEPVRTNRTTQHWRVGMTQADAAGGSEASVMQAQAVTGVRREVWSGAAAAPPAADPPAALARRKGRDGIVWFDRYDIRFQRHPYQHGDDEPVVSWVRDEPPRALDFPALAAICDTFFPAIFARRRAMVPIATVSMNVYFHADAAAMAMAGDDYLLGVGRSNVYEGGFFDAEAQVWGAGRLIATTHQLAWYRE